MKDIRITQPIPGLESEIQLNEKIKSWLDQSISILEYKLKYAKIEDVPYYQGALRALCDLRNIVI